MIRKPVSEVYNAFVDPAVTTRFWFTRSDGALSEGKNIRWSWDMYGVSATVHVNKMIANELISIRWGDPETTVDFEFRELAPDRTYVVIRNHGFKQEGSGLIALIKDNTAGFTSVLDGLKAWLEYGIELNIVLDKFPDKWNAGQQTLGEWQKGR